MSEQRTPAQYASWLVKKTYHRVIGQALVEGATTQQVQDYMLTLGVKDPATLVQIVQARKIIPVLGGGELLTYGGRNAFRALFGLAPIAEHIATTFDPLTSDAFKATELGDAEFFAEFYADKLRYDHRMGRWLVSDEETGLWIHDPVREVMPLAGVAMRARQKIAGTELENEPREVRKAAIDWANKGESNARLTNMINLASTIAPLADAGEHWDEDPWLLGCQNGVVDLRTGELRRALPEEHVTMRVKVAYDPDAKCPLWEQTLASVFAPNEFLSAEESPKTIAFLQRAFGYSICGDCREECLFFTWGGGSNGKGTIMNTIGYILGDYMDDMPYTTLEKAQRAGGIPNDIAKLAGKRFVTCGEVNEFVINESRVKAITGRDPITARFLNHEFFTFLPVCKIWIATNNKPRISGTDDGIWRRIILIPFLNSFDGPNKNSQLKDQLRLEAQGILTWLVKGTQLWLRDGLNPPDSVRAATDAYRLESDPITPFIESQCVQGASFRVQASKAFAAYIKFCNDTFIEDYNRLSDKAFQKSMKKRFKCDDKGRHVFYNGVGLLAEGAHAEEAGERSEGQGKVPF